MINVSRVLMLLAFVGSMSGCNSKGNSPSTVPARIEQKKVLPSQMSDSERAVAFLTAIQNNDKKKTYEISNLTVEMVNESREKLTNSRKYKLTKKERAETEHALRMSGSIDFFLKKLTKILPKTAQLEVIKKIADVAGDNSKNAFEIKITYGKPEDGVVDKTGKKTREIVVRLQQIKHVVYGNNLQEFVFDSKDFEKMAVNDFIVLSYF